MSRMNSYDPFTYQPMMKAFYLGRQFPQTISTLQAQYPAQAAHIGAVYQFSNWLQQNMPDVWSNINLKNSALLDAGKAVLSGKVTANGKTTTATGMSGMGDITVGDYTVTDSGDVTGTASSTPPVVPSGNIVTDWGKSVMDFAKSYLTYDSQKQLLAANIKRAEMGLPPLDASQYGLGVNVGLSPATQNLVIGGLVILGLYAAFSAVKKR